MAHLHPTDPKQQASARFRSGFTKWENSLFDHGLNAHEIALLLTLKSHLPNVQPGFSRLAAMSGMARSTAHAALARLEALGLVRVERGQLNSNGQVKPNRYFLTDTTPDPAPDVRHPNVRQANVRHPNIPPPQRPSHSQASFKPSQADIPDDLQHAADNLLAFWSSKDGRRSSAAWDLLCSELQKIQQDIAGGAAVVREQLKLAAASGWKSVTHQNWTRYGKDHPSGMVRRPTSQEQAFENVIEFLKVQEPEFSEGDPPSSSQASHTSAATDPDLIDVAAATVSDVRQANVRHPNVRETDTAMFGRRTWRCSAGGHKEDEEELDEEELDEGVEARTAAAGAAHTDQQDPIFIKAFLEFNSRKGSSLSARQLISTVSDLIASDLRWPADRSDELRQIVTAAHSRVFPNAA